MKKIILIGISILFVLTGACQPPVNVQETATQTPVQMEATIPPTQTPSPEPTVTSTPVPLTFPMDAGTALPEDFSSLKISPENAVSLEEIIRIKQKDIVFFDAKYWNGNWLVDTNQGAKLLNENGEWLADLVTSQRTCPKSSHMITGDPSNIYIGPGGIGIVSVDGVHVYSLDGQQEIAFVALDRQYVFSQGCQFSSFLAAVSPDMKWVAVTKPGISYNTTEIISIESGENIISLPGDAVRMFSPDSQYLLFESGENRYFVYKTSDWSRSLLLRMDEFVFNFGFSPSGEYMFYQRSSGWVIFRPSDVNTNLVNKQVVSFMFNGNSNEVGMLYWGDEENVYVWDFDSKQEIRVDKISTGEWELPVMDQPLLTGFEMKGYVNRGTFNTVCDFKEGGFTCYSGPTVCSFDLAGMRDCQSVQMLTGIKRTMNNMEYNLYEKDGSYAGLLPPWEKEADRGGIGSTWAMTLATDDPPGYLWSMMSPDKSHFMYTTVAPGNQLNISLHFVSKETEIGQIKLQQLISAVISPNSKYMLATVDTIGDQVWLLDLETGKVIKELVKVNDSGRGARGLAFSTDSRLAAYVDVKSVSENGRPLSMGKLSIYDLAAGKDQISIDLDLSKGNVNALAFSPDSTLIAVGTFDGKVSIYSVATGELVNSWYAHVGVVSDLDFSPDGNWLLTAGGMDENIKLWTVAP